MATAEPRTETVDTTSLFEVSFFMPESHLESGFACAGLLCSKIYIQIPQIIAIEIFVVCCTGQLMAVDFAILRSHFWYRQTVPKMAP